MFFMHFTFEYSLAFFGLFVLPCLYFCRRRSGRCFLPKLEWIPKKSRWLHKTLLQKMAIFALGVTALASPILYTSKMPSERRGVGIVLALDTSGSMRESGFDAKESQKSKFELSKRIASGFIDRREGDNIGVVAFGSFAFTASPVSYDHEGIKALLDMLEVEIAGKNTAIGEGIAQSLRTLTFTDAKTKVIVLVTDGKNNSGKISPKEAVQKAEKAGVKIFAIGLGTPKDYDRALLERIASETGGKAFGAKDARSLSEVYREIDRLLPSPIRSARYLDKRRLFVWPLLGALAMLLWYLYRREGKR